MVTSSQIKKFQKKILDRYAVHKRVLPWRDTDDPYKVFISEVMLQQTQVDRVSPKFLAWLHILPTMESLAKVEKTVLLGLRSGLGFNSRAIRLQQAAQEMVKRFWWKVPRTREELISLPGIGPYTSASILAFAYKLPTPVVDTNIRRVLMWELGIKEELSPKELEELALRCIPDWRSNDRNNALMDYGSSVATVQKTWIKPLSKQSKFEGSPRQVRWKILRHLLTHKTATRKQLQTLFPHEKFHQVIEGMVRDGIVRLDKEIVSLE